LLPGATYHPFATNPEHLEAFMKNVQTVGLRGFNVTIPYKEAVIPYLDSLSPYAQEIGAVNCVVVEEDGSLVGHNFDGPAFLATLKGRLPRTNRAVVLGSGGAARAVVWALDRLGFVDIRVLTRSLEKSEQRPFPSSKARVQPYGEAAQRGIVVGADLVVNATPVGQGELVDLLPINTRLTQGQLAYDLVYAPYPTKWLETAQDTGAQIFGGLEMLARQAALSLEQWVEEEKHIPWQPFLGVLELIR